MPVGGSFSYRLQFPDPGVYWYHPHIREDYGQELGLYGNILVVPTDPDYWAPVNREIVLTLDDVLLEDGKIAPFSRSETTYVAMGRFGNILLVAGEPDLELERAARRGGALLPDEHREHPGLQRRAAGCADEAGRWRQRPLSSRRSSSMRSCWHRRSAWSSTSLFDTPGQVTLVHDTPDRCYPLGGDHGQRRTGRNRHWAKQFDVMRRNADMVAERERISRLPGRRAGQDAGLRRRDGHGRPGGRGRLHLPDAPGGRQR